jgi:hypothetical protein
MQCVLSLFEEHEASQSALQSARQSTEQSNLPGSTVHLPVQPAWQLTSQFTLGNSHCASQSSASFALQAARTLIGVHIVLHSADGGTTVHSASA